MCMYVCVRACGCGCGFGCVYSSWCGVIVGVYVADGVCVEL